MIAIGQPVATWLILLLATPSPAGVSDAISRASVMPAVRAPLAGRVRQPVNLPKGPWYSRLTAEDQDDPPPLSDLFSEIPLLLASCDPPVAGDDAVVPCLLPAFGVHPIRIAPKQSPPLSPND
jgi:hypothetical protein